MAEHLWFMVANGIDVNDELKALPSFYWLTKIKERPYGSVLL